MRGIHERIYFRPLLEAFTEAPSGLTPEAAVERLEAFGFTDAMRTKAAVKELTRGLNRTSRLMQQMLPLLLDWLSTAPDPDLGLLVLRNMLDDPARGVLLIEAFRDSPEAARRLCQLVGTSRLLGDIVASEPRSRASAPLRRPAGHPAARRPGRRCDHRHRVARRAADVRAAHEALEGSPPTRHRGARCARSRRRRRSGSDLTTLAEATLEATLGTLDPQVPFAVIGMGRFGGGEMSYASDLDVLFVYEGTGVATVEEADRVAKALNRFLNGATPAERLYPIDADLRPEGKQGPTGTESSTASSAIGTPTRRRGNAKP